MSKKYENLYKILAEEIKERLNNSQIQLDGERELALKHNVSRQTVRKTLDLMQQQGLIEKVQGSGIYLTGVLPGHGTQSVALIVNDDKEYLTPSFISELESGLSEAGFELKIFSTDSKPENERIILNNINTDSLRLVIAETLTGVTFTPNFDLYESFSSKKIPVLFLNGTYQNLSNYLHIKYNSYNGAYSLCKYLLDKGRKNIAGIFQTDALPDQEKLFGLSRCLIDYGDNLAADNILSFDRTQLLQLRKKNDTNFISKFISRSLKNCDAVICSNDEIAYHLIRELSYSSFLVPADIRVVSFDDSYLCTLSQISITSLAPAKDNMCSATLNTALQLIKNLPCGNTILEYKLIERKS